MQSINWAPSVLAMNPSLSPSFGRRSHRFKRRVRAMRILDSDRSGRTHMSELPIGTLGVVTAESRYNLRQLFGDDAFYDSLDDVMENYSR